MLLKHFRHATETKETNISNKRNATGRRQPVVHLQSATEEFELGTTEKQIPLLAGWRP